MSKARTIIVNTSLTLVTLLILLLVLEFIFSAQKEQNASGQHIPLYITTDKSYLYGMNPQHKRVNSHGLRDDEFSTEKPSGTYRILVLGDSIPYGRTVGKRATFPNQLEKMLNEQGLKAEVINAGISGYTPYNELHYYLEEGRKFSADLVILSFCMNDVANPRLHWNYTGDAITDIPEAAIPNLDYDQNVIQPLLSERDASIKRKLQGAHSLMKAIVVQSDIYQYIDKKLDALFPSPEQQALQKKQADIRQKIPTYITGEDDLSIEVLTRPDSPEWQWLSTIYQQIQQATREDNVPLVLAIFPLAYQLDPDYPHFPQKLFAEYCQEQQLDCLDFLQAFKPHGKEKLFMLDKERGYDVWHLTEAGHAEAARALFAHLQQQNLLPPQSL